MLDYLSKKLTKLILCNISNELQSADIKFAKRIYGVQ